MWFLLLILLLLALFGGLGFAVHALWFVLIAVVILAVVGWFSRRGPRGPGPGPVV